MLVGNRIENTVQLSLNVLVFQSIPINKFSKYDEAIAFVLKNKEKRYVSKPIGDGAKAISYCSKDWRDMVFMLNKWKKSNAYDGEFVFKSFMLALKWLLVVGLVLVDSLNTS